MQLTCKYCGFQISENFNFCPNCGKNLKPVPLSTSVGKQVYIYAISLLLPPLGLLPAFKYLREKNQKAKIVGIVAIILTVVSIALTIQLLQSLFGNATSQLDQLQNLGY